MKGWPNLEATTIIDAHVEDYNSLKPGQFCNLRQFKLQQTDEWHQTLILQLNDEAGDRQLTLTFQGIIGLEFLPRGFQPIPLYLEVALLHKSVLDGKSLFFRQNGGQSQSLLQMQPSERSISFLTLFAFMQQRP